MKMFRSLLSAKLYNDISFILSNYVIKISNKLYYYLFGNDDPYVKSLLARRKILINRYLAIQENAPGFSLLLPTLGRYVYAKNYKWRMLLATRKILDHIL